MYIYIYTANIYIAARANTPANIPSRIPVFRKKGELQEEDTYTATYSSIRTCIYKAARAHIPVNMPTG